MALSRIHSLVSTRFFTDYEDQTPSEDDETLVVPEDLSTLSDEDLDALHDQAVSAFEAIYGDGEGLTEEQVASLGGVTEGIESLRVEQERRHAEAAERSEAAAALAARVLPVEDEVAEAETGEAETEGEGDDGEEVAAETETPEVVAEVEPVEESLAAASPPARREVRVNLSGLRSRQPASPSPRPATEATTMRDIVTAASDVSGFSGGMDFMDMGRAVDRRLASFNEAEYAQAARQGRHLSQQFGLAVIRKPFEEDLMIRSTDFAHVDKVLSHAVDESRLPGGSLVASGGWCAPSETVYDLFEIESRDGLFSLPEVGISRGGIRFTPGPDFASIYGSAASGFAYTEAEDIAGDYDGQGGGSKPCYKIPCPEFQEERLDLAGLCITAGLLQSRGYPEVIARIIRGALVAHDHRMSGRLITNLVAGSTAVSMPASQVGATAPILTAIELQVEHYKGLHRLSRSTSLEAVFPFWVRGAIRADLSRRLGVDMFSVPDSRIAGWFSERGVNPQFIWNWQGLETTAASAMIAFPQTVDFLLYAAGTWVRGGSDVITVDTLYDSVKLGTNDFTALFTEEGWLTAKRGHDSRVVTVPICADGATHVGVAIDCDGSEGSPT